MNTNVLEAKIRLCSTCNEKFNDFRKFLTKEVKQNFVKDQDFNNTFEEIGKYSEINEEIDFINNSKATIFHKNLDSKLEQLISSFFKQFNLFETYYPIILNFIKVALNEVRPNSVFWGDYMDINHYIKIKKILYHDISETKYIRGIVCKKSLLDRKIKSNVENARILLFCCSIDVDFLQPNNNFGSFERFISQEKNYFKKIVINIAKLKPNVIFIEKNINRYVAEFLKNKNIMVFIKVKLSLMSKIARLTRCKIVKDITKLDKLKEDDYIGKCSVLYLKKIPLIENKANEFDSDSSKDFLYIEGCNPLYGITITISGPDIEQLKSLKKCLRTLFKIGRNWLLENNVITEDQEFEKEIKSIYFTQGNLAKQLPENVSFEKMTKKNSIFYTKLNFIQKDIKNIPDFLKNPFLIEDVKLSLDIESENSILKSFKLDYFAEVCGYPSLKNIEFYSKDDISLGAYIILKANNIYSKCMNCNRPRHQHVVFYYLGENYIKITTEFHRIKKTTPTKQSIRFDESFTINNSQYHKSNQLLTSRSLNPFNFTSHIFSPTFESSPSERIKRNHSTKEISLLALKSSEKNFEKNIDSIHKTRTSGFRKDSTSPANHRPKSQNFKRNAIIRSYLECAFCSEKLTEEKVLDHEYLEYSLASLLTKMFQGYFSFENLIKLQEKQTEEFSCVHILKVRVFQYEETMVKFYVNYSKFYKIDHNMMFNEYKITIKGIEVHLVESKKKEYEEIMCKSLERFGVLVDYFRKDEEIVKFGHVDYIENLLKEIKACEKNLKEIFQRNYEFQCQIEEIRIMICREIIGLFDIFLSLIRVNKKSNFLEKYMKLSSVFSFKKEDELENLIIEEKTHGNLIKMLLQKKKKDFFPEYLLKYLRETACFEALEDEEEEDHKKNLHLYDANLKLSCEPIEFLYGGDYEITPQKKVSDLVSKLFIEPHENFKEKFRNDEAFQIKHLEIEFRDFMKITSGQSIDGPTKNIFEETQKLQFFVKKIFLVFLEIFFYQKDIPINKYKPLSIIAHALNSLEYLKEIHFVSSIFF